MPSTSESCVKFNEPLMHQSCILGYHKIEVAPASARFVGLYVGRRSFCQQLKQLATVDATCLDLRSITAGEKGFVLTFDDAFQSVFVNALPELRVYGYRAITFVVAGKVGGRNDWDVAAGCVPAPLMNEAELKEWIKAGHEIGGHTMTHPWLSHLKMSEARREIVDCKRSLEDRFGVRLKHFCYPFGDYNKEIRDMVEEAGYETACTTAEGSIGHTEDLFALPRKMIYSRRYHHWIGQIIQKLGTSGQFRAGHLDPNQ